MASLEFQLIPGANNGLAIRYPGDCDPSMVGICELQILDDTYRGYDKFDPRMFHGSAFGMVPAHWGYLRLEASGISRRTPLTDRESRWNSTAP